jgi:hypothetical protein
MNILSGAIIMRESSELGWHEIVMLNVSTVICIVGVFLLSKKWNHEKIKRSDSYVSDDLLVN